MSTVAIFVLTWNRASLFEKTMKHSLRNTGRAWDELFWVDNGSTPDQLAIMKETMVEFSPTATVFFKNNTGMQRGYNTAMSLCRSDYILMFSPDCLMEDGWLETFMHYVETIPNTGLATMYSIPIETVPERYRHGKKNPEMLNGLPILRAMPMEMPIFRRDLFKHVGYYREDFGLYGWGDVEWSLRCERIMTERNVEYYVIPGHTYKHLGSEGAAEFKLGAQDGDTQEYWEWKKAQTAAASNHAIMAKCRKENYPFYSPF